GHTAYGVTDGACMKCHAAGQHAPGQDRYTGPDGQAAECASCHREHHGQSLTRLADVRCTECHADLKRHVTDGKTEYAAKITSFADHPPFGAWRKRELR